MWKDISMHEKKLLSTKVACIRNQSISLWSSNSIVADYVSRYLDVGRCLHACVYTRSRSRKKSSLLLFLFSVASDSAKININSISKYGVIFIPPVCMFTRLSLTHTHRQQTVYVR